MFIIFHQTILVPVAFTIASLAYGQTADSPDWRAILQQSGFAEVISTKKIDKNIRSEFPSWEKMSKSEKQFNATDFGGGKRQRLFFIARADNHWIISYEHGGRGYHTHCFLITVDSSDKLDVLHSDIKFDTLGDLKEFANTKYDLFRKWQGDED